MDIFLTGATGLIGGEVLARLLSSGHSVHALVRKRSRSETLPDVKQRLLARLKQSPKYDGSHGRLHVVIGDVCQDPSTWVLGCRAEYNTIIHCACDTSFTREYSASHSNVLGMRSMLAFANCCDSDPLFVMFSTSYVNTSPHDCVIDEREVTSKDAACNGYIASKIQCEVFLRESRLRHLILRPSVVLSRGVDSRDYARSILWAVRVIAELGELPVDENTRMDVVPVDYVANATVGLVNAFADYRAVQEIVHISCGKTSAELLSSVFRHSSAAVAPLGHISFTGRGTPWSKRVHGAVANLRIISALEHYLPFMRANVVYSNDRLRGILGGDLSQCDPVSIYLPELLANVSYKEALHESFKP